MYRPSRKTGGTGDGNSNRWIDEGLVKSNDRRELAWSVTSIYCYCDENNKIILVSSQWCKVWTQQGKNDTHSGGFHEV